MSKLLLIGSNGLTRNTRSMYKLNASTPHHKHPTIQNRFAYGGESVVRGCGVLLVNLKYLRNYLFCVHLIKLDQHYRTLYILSPTSLISCKKNYAHGTCWILTDQSSRSKLAIPSNTNSPSGWFTEFFRGWEYSPIVYDLG
jgi:hypothetical protein